MGMHGDAVWRACILYLPPSDAEDVFQETFVKLAMHDGSFRDDEHAKAWLLRVAMNGCKDVLKSARRRQSSLDERIERCGDEALGVEAGDPCGLREILDAMDTLGDPPKTQLYLSLYEGYSAREISELCGMPEGTVYSWISRGRERLKEALS